MKPDTMICDDGLSVYDPVIRSMGRAAWRATLAGDVELAAAVAIEMAEEARERGYRELFRE